MAIKNFEERSKKITSFAGTSVSSIFFAFFLSLSAFASQASQNSSKNIQVNFGTYIECPYICENSTDHPGYIIEIIKGAFANSKIKLKFVNYPYTRLKQNIRKGLIDITVMPTFEILNDNDLTALETVIGVHFMGIAYQGKEVFFSSLENIAHKKVILTKGSYYSDRIEASLANLNQSENLVFKISGHNAEERKLKMLLLDRVDIVLSDYNTLSYITSQKFSDRKLRLARTSFTGFTPIVVVIEKSNKKMEIINKMLTGHLVEIRKNGKLQYILNKYNIPDWNFYSSRAY